MRLVADEDVYAPVVQALRGAGHDVVWIREVSRAAADSDVAALARIENRILVTRDLDFGDLIFSQRLPSPPGVILLRFPPGVRADEVARVVLAAFASDRIWEGFFSVVDRRRVRQRRLPGESLRNGR